MPSKSSILIVDSDAYLAGMYGRKFEAEGWKVMVAETLADAQKFLKKKTPSVILLEPDMDEDKSEALVKSAIAPVVILTTLSEKSEIERMKRAGAASYLLKGHFVPSEVVTKVKGLVK